MGGTSCGRIMFFTLAAGSTTYVQYVDMYETIMQLYNNVEKLNNYFNTMNGVSIHGLHLLFCTCYDRHL